MRQDFMIDKRKKEDLLYQISALSKAYTPEWQFDTSNPDIGSVLALLFCEQMQENIRHLNTLPQQYYERLIQMLGISLKPAYPAHSIVLLHLVRDTVPGFLLPRQTKLLGTDESQNDLIFETADSVYITQARIIKAFMVSGADAAIVPLLGSFLLTDYTQEVTRELPKPYEMKEMRPFQMFDVHKDGYARCGLMLYHEYMFDTQTGDIQMRIVGNDALAEAILDGQYRLSYYTQNGFEVIQEIRMEEKGLLVFRKERECKKVWDKSGSNSVLLLEPRQSVSGSVTVSDLCFSSSGAFRSPEYVAALGVELEASEFLPFGRSLSLFAEVFIGHVYFAKPDALITLEFTLEYETVIYTPPKYEQQTELKIIKRKPYKPVESAAAQVYADEIALSYYNGSGWKRLETMLPVAHLFRDKKEGLCSITFLCPKDWKETGTGSYRGNCIRIQLLRADNCYYQPALHHVPVIKNLTASYTYENRFERPSRLISYQGSRKRDITDTLGTARNVPILFPSPYTDTALYLGLDKCTIHGPVSILFQIEKDSEAGENPYMFSYSAPNGFAGLKVMDRTDGFSHTGTVLFMPPSDWTKSVLEGVEAYWLRITQEGQALEQPVRHQPKIHAVALNAVEVDNIETLEEESYYLERYEPNMEFALNVRNILSVDVWVNETQLFPRARLEQMALENPGRVRLEYDGMGEPSECYVKWSEVDNFDHSSQNDRHFVVDRMNGVLYFGDGVHVKIPQNTKGIAFRTIIRRCDGERANIGAGQVTGGFDELLFVERLSNPVPAFGGMDMESTQGALRRGSTMLNNRGRLVTALDIELAALAFSRRIAQARVVMGTRKDGGYDAGALTLVLLVDDYQEGGLSFLSLKPRLMRQLCERCALSIDRTRLEIVEPLFLEICVEAWIVVLCENERFAVWQELVRMLRDYLNPVKNDCWKIGDTAVFHQIALRLNMEKGTFLVRRLMVTACYQDETGRHETGLDAFSHNPFVIVTSGEHKIHIEQ